MSAKGFGAKGFGPGLDNIQARKEKSTTLCQEFLMIHRIYVQTEFLSSMCTKILNIDILSFIFYLD